MGQDKPGRILAESIAKQDLSAFFKIGKVNRIVDVTEGVQITESDIDIYLKSLRIIQFLWRPVVCSVFTRVNFPARFPENCWLRLDLIYESVVICQAPG